MSLVFAGKFFSWQGLWGRWGIYSEDFWNQVSDFCLCFLPFHLVSNGVHSLFFLFSLHYKSLFASLLAFFLIYWLLSLSEMLRLKTRCCLICMNMVQKMQYAPWRVIFSYSQASHVSHHHAFFCPHNFLVMYLIKVNFLASAFKDLKVIIETNEVDATKGARRRLVRLLWFFYLRDWTKNDSLFQVLLITSEGSKTEFIPYPLYFCRLWSY